MKVETPLVKSLPAARRRAVSASPQSLVRAEPMSGESLLPLVVRPALGGVELASWAAGNREWLEARLREHGAILFRDFPLGGADAFEAVVTAISGAPMEYRERSSPRSRVGGQVYTSTDYPPEQSIFPHNEHSYAQTWPMKLFFYCETAAREGGETPLADCRRVYQRIDPRIRERFARSGWIYARNFGDGFGLPWRTVFQTDDRATVEAYCLANDIEFEWKPGDRLRTRQRRAAAAAHPRTGEPVWFNHATFFHVSTLAPAVRDALLTQFTDEDLPNNSYYGDGQPIEPEVLEHLREAYLREVVTFSWQQGDLVMLDNMLTAHARNPYVGRRRVLFAMSEPFNRQDLTQ